MPKWIKNWNQEIRKLLMSYHHRLIHLYVIFYQGTYVMSSCLEILKKVLPIIKGIYNVNFCPWSQHTHTINPCAILKFLTHSSRCSPVHVCACLVFWIRSNEINKSSIHSAHCNNVEMRQVFCAALSSASLGVSNQCTRLIRLHMASEPREREKKTCLQ